MDPAPTPPSAAGAAGTATSTTAGSAAADAGQLLADQLITMASGAWVSQMVFVAAELALADQLAAGERGVEELAAACGADADGLFRLLRGLAGLGIFRETGPRRFALTPLAELLHSVRTGAGAFRHRYGQSVFAYYQHHPQRAEVFDGAMGDFSRIHTQAVLAAYDFRAIHHLVDVGGGGGQLLAMVLAAQPHLRGTLFDQPQVVAPVQVPPELAGRWTVAGGDFFAGVPTGADAYLLKHIIHDWDDGACRRILTHVRAALLESVGLLMRRIVATASPVSVVEAVAA